MSRTRHRHRARLDVRLYRGRKRARVATDQVLRAHLTADPRHDALRAVLADHLEARGQLEKATALRATAPELLLPVLTHGITTRLRW